MSAWHVRHAIGQQKATAAARPADAPPGTRKPHQHGVGELASNIDGQVEPMASQPPAPTDDLRQPCPTALPREPRGLHDVQVVYTPAGGEQVIVRGRREDMQSGPRMEPPQSS